MERKIFFLTFLFIIFFFTPSLISTAHAQTITGGNCTAPSSTRSPNNTTSGTFTTTDRCNNVLTWQNACYTGTDTSGGSCTFCQDECVSSNCQNRCQPPPSCTPIAQCGFPTQNASFTYTSCNGTGVYCTGSYSNTSCKYCQGWSRCECQNGVPTEIACPSQEQQQQGLCQTTNPCANVSCALPTATPTPTPTPVLYNISASIIRCDQLSGGGYVQSSFPHTVTISLSGPVSTSVQGTGSYRFDNLPAGSYSVSTNPPDSTWNGPFNSCGGTSFDGSITLGPNGGKTLYFRQDFCPVFWAQCTGTSQCTASIGTRTGYDNCGRTYTSTCTLSAEPTKCPTPTAVPAGYTLSCNGTSMSIAGSPTCSGCSNGWDNATGQWAWIGASVPSTNTVSANHSITAFVNGSQVATNTCSVANNPTPTPSACNCTADNPSPGECTTGVCSGTSTPCQRCGPPPADNIRTQVRFFDADCATPYSGPATIKVLDDDRIGDGHNSLFYGYNGTSNHIYTGGACDVGETHPYMDPGYQLNADGTIAACPGNNIDGTPGRQMECRAGHWTDPDYGDQDSGMCNCGGGTCVGQPHSVSHEHKCQITLEGRVVYDYCGGEGIQQFNGNDSCIANTPSGSTFPRCFDPHSTDVFTVTSSNRIIARENGYHCRNADCTDRVAPRDQTHAFSVAAPSGYRLQVLELMSVNQTPGWNRYNGGDTSIVGNIKGFNFPGPGGYLNHWASDATKPDGNTTVLAYDICVQPPVFTLSGNVFVDTNKNGVKDAGEASYQGAGLSLSGRATTTDSSGNYSYTSVSAGSYTLTTVLPYGYVATTTNPVNLTLTADTTVNFGIVPNWTISGTVCMDTNQNGVQDSGESLVSGASISLSGTQTGSATTNASGSYSLPNLQSGSYTVTLNPPAGYQTTTTNPRTLTINADTTVNFCMTTLNSIAGRVFVDSDKNKQKGGSETDFTIGTSSISFRNVGTGTTYNTTTTNGVYDSGSTLPAGTYEVSYTSLPTGYQMTYPVNGPPPNFTVTVGFGCTTNGHNVATCTGTNNITNLNFGVSNSFPWCRCEGGDCRFDNGLSCPVPATATAACGSTYASLAGPTSDQPGVIFTGDTSYSTSFGAGQASPDPYNWIVGGTTYPETFTPVNAGVIRTSYSYVATSLKQSGITATDLTPYCTGGLDSCNLSTSLPNGVYLANGNLVLTSTSGKYTFPTDKNFVLLVNGNLTIAEEILVPNGSTATFLASGNITVFRTVGSTTITTACVPSTTKGGVSTGCHVEGFYSAGGSFTIDGRNDCTVEADRRLNIAGAVVTNANLSGGSFTNNRDMCASNLQCPTYAVTARPDLLLNAPDLIKYQNYIWQEIAP